MASPLATVASGQSKGPWSVDETTVVGQLSIRSIHGSRWSPIAGSICTNNPNVVAPKTIRCSPS